MARKSEPDAEGKAPTPEETAKTYRIHAQTSGEIDKLMSEVAGLRGEISGNRKRYEKLGGDYDIIKAAFKLEEHADPARFIRDLNQTVVTVGIILVDEDKTGQVSFLRTFEAAKGPEVDKIINGRIRAQGYNDGLAGGDGNTNPYPTGSESHVVWTKGFKEGVADRRASGKADRTPSTEVRKRGAAAEADQPAADAAPKKGRGRPKGSGNKASRAAPGMQAAAE